MIKFSKVASFIKVLWKYLCFYTIISPRTTSHFLRTIGDLIIEYDSTKAFFQASECKVPIKSIEFAELFSGIERKPIQIMRRIKRDEGELMLEELVVLCAICKHTKPRMVFEFGTFKGDSALNLALNSPDNCEIFTLDLPPSSRKRTRYSIEIGPIRDIQFTVGEKYHGSTIERKIKQLYGDSATFNYSQFYNCIDLVFVDGNHQYDNVKADSENAFRMLSDKGIILWHDYTVRSGHQHPDVVKYLNELSKSMQLFNIASTSFVIAWQGDKLKYDR